MILLDYIFYRWYHIYRPHTKYPDMFASVMVSTYLSLTSINLVLLYSLLFNVSRPSDSLMFVMIIFFGVFGYYRYEHISRFAFLDEKWRHESAASKKIRITLLIAYLLVIFITPWIYGFATH